MENKLTPQAIVDKAQRAYREGLLEAAADGFAQAAASYESGGEKALAAEMKNNQSVALLRAGQAEAALEAVEGTDAVFAAIGDLKHQGMALTNHGSALEKLKRYSDAIQAYHLAADVLENAGLGDLRAEVMQTLSVLLFRRGKFMDAAIALMSGLGGVENPTPRQKLMKKILSALPIWR
ncbi:MAG: hypothetical protein ABIJ39_14300 [Chloroflexota bacterium]